MFPSPPRSRAGSKGIELNKYNEERGRVNESKEMEIEMQQQQQAAAYTFFSAAKAEAEAEKPGTPLAAAEKEKKKKSQEGDNGEHEMQEMPVDLDAYRFGKYFSNPSTPQPYQQVFQQSIPLSPSHSHVIGSYTPPRAAFGSLPGVSAFSHDDEQDDGQERRRGGRGNSSDVDDALSQDYEQDAGDRKSSRFSFD